MNRLLKYINLAIALVLVAVAGVVYWFAWRVLPRTSGVLAAPVSKPATIRRDTLGVPHIQAASIDDALFLQGLVTAQDRLWQMDVIRRFAAGELAEVVGRPALESDREMRRLRLRRVAEEQYRKIPPADRALLAAYARGVNFFLETHQGALPLEFTVLGYHPRPWSVIDTLLAGLQMSRFLSTTWRDEIQKSGMLAGGDAAKVNFLYPARSGSETQPGSNAWVLAGSRTASGRPLLANDPHLEFAIPATWYLTHLEAPGLNVSGASLPGIPAVIIGHNERIAWGVTNLHFDVQDLYIEKFDPQSGRYSFRGQVEQARVDRELVSVKGEKAVEVVTWITRHGPILIAEGGHYLALRWAATEPASSGFPFVDLGRARDWREFRAALERFAGPAQNFVYADTDGNIGYQATGKLPIRKSYDGSVPVDGSSGDFEWEGFIPFDELPSVYNPPSGMIVTANQNPFPADYRYRVSGNFASHYRSRQIASLLEARKGWRPAEMLAVQKDVYSAFAHFLARQAVAAVDARGTRNPVLGEAVALIRNWNGQMENGTAAPLVATLLYQHVRKAIAESASPGKGLAYDYQMAPAVVERLLRERPKGWFGDYDEKLVSALADAVEEGMRMQGRSVGRWDYGRYNQLFIQHPVGGRFPAVGQYFNIGPVSMSGSSTTVKQTTRRLGPSMRMVADASDWERSLQNITIGQSGQILSRHFKDQWGAYYAARSMPMQFRRVEAKSTLRIEPARP